MLERRKNDERPGLLIAKVKQKERQKEYQQQDKQQNQ